MATITVIVTPYQLRACCSLQQFACLAGLLACIREALEREYIASSQVTHPLGACYRQLAWSMSTGNKTQSSLCIHDVNDMRPSYWMQQGKEAVEGDSAPSIRNAMQRILRHYRIWQWFRILADFLHQADFQSLEPLLRHHQIGPLAFCKMKQSLS